MKSTCRFCGAAVNSQAKICPGCGKVLPAYRGVDLNLESRKKKREDGLTPDARINPVNTSASVRAATQIGEADVNYGKAKSTKQNNIDYLKTLEMTHSAFMTSASSGKFKNQSIFASSLGRAIKFIFILLVVFACYIAIKVTLVMNASYNFKSGYSVESTLPNQNYRQAISAYFEEGHWWYDLGSNRVMYRGTDYRGDKYIMYFDKFNGQISVTTLYINGVRITGDHDIMYKYVIVMFRTPKARKAPTATGGDMTGYPTN